MRINLFFAGMARRIIGDHALSRLFAALNRASGGAVPIWPVAMPAAAPPPARHVATGREQVVYFPSCATRVFGPAPSDPEQATVPEIVHSLLDKAGYDVVLPASLEGLCCGMPFNSKGFIDVGKAKLDELAAALRKASHEGRDAIVFDTSPCALRAKQVAVGAGLKVYDLVEAIEALVLDRVETQRSDDAIAIHTTCSGRRMGLEQAMQRIAARFTDQVVVPADIQCCGFAGDKGFNVPELNASALRHLKSALPESCDRGYSTSRTCEIGLTEHSGRPYQSISYLVDRLTRARHDAGRRN
ncbi:MAG: (Fe-S)-binding protein [Hyphomicrobiaceae bacterium]